MLKVDRVSTSSKVIGRFEGVLISRLSSHFREQGYTVFPHARFNIAWGNSLSDIDILLLKGDSLTVVEVKSRRDKISRAGQQMRRISDFVDYGYVATDRLPVNWTDPAVGLMLVSKTIETVNKAKRFRGRPNIDSISALQKRCLLRFFGRETSSHFLKHDIAETVRLMGTEESIRRCLKKIVTCGRYCDTDCPITRFALKNWLRGSPDPFSGYRF